MDHSVLTKQAVFVDVLDALCLVSTPELSTFANKLDSYGRFYDVLLVYNPDSKRESYEQRADHTSRHTKNEEWGAC